MRVRTPGSAEAGAPVRAARRHPGARLRHRRGRRRVLAPARRIRRRRHQGRVTHLPRLHPSRGPQRDVAVVRLVVALEAQPRCQRQDRPGPGPDPRPRPHERRRRREQRHRAPWHRSVSATTIWPAINPRIVMASSQLVGSRGPNAHWTGLRPDHPDLRRSAGVVGLRRRRSAGHQPDDLPRPPRRTPLRARRAGGSPGPRPRRTGAAMSRSPRSRRSSTCWPRSSSKRPWRRAPSGPWAIVTRTARPRGPYPCAGDEQWVVISVRDDDDWARLRTALGDPAWAADPEWGTGDGTDRRRSCHRRAPVGVDGHARTCRRRRHAAGRRRAVRPDAHRHRHARRPAPDRAGLDARHRSARRRDP